MKRSLTWVLGFVVAGSVLGGCFAFVDPSYPGVYVPGPPVIVSPPVVVAPHYRGGWHGRRGGWERHGWERRGHR